jgi:hypothetical protein
MPHDDDDQAKIISFPVSKNTAGGEFFVVDRRAFAAACRLGLNPAVAYLAIARGAGSRPKSLWSVDAIERYSGISRPKAKLAVTTLVDKGLLTLERAGTRPLYGIGGLHQHFLTGKHDAGEDTGLPDFWSALRAFEDCGLIEFIPHVFESDGPEAEMLHA